MHRCHAYCYLLIADVVSSRHTTSSSYSTRWRESVAWRYQTTVAEGIMLIAVPLTEIKSKLFVYGKLPKKYNST